MATEEVTLRVALVYLSLPLLVCARGRRAGELEGSDALSGPGGKPPPLERHADLKHGNFRAIRKAYESVLGMIIRPPRAKCVPPRRRRRRRRRRGAAHAPFGRE